jgi:hypothetical protein
MKRAQSIMAESPSDGSKLESLSNKALGVLSNDGPYACMLFLGQGPDKSIKGIIRNGLLELSSSIFEIRDFNIDSDEGRSSYIASVAENLDDYLLLKRLWHRTLIYLRYHAKGLKARDTKGHNEEG